MRMKDILGEARRQPSLPGMSIKQRVSPDIINMLMHKHIYDKEVDAINAANSEKNIPDTKPKKPKIPPTDPMIRLYGNFLILASHIQDWVDNRNEKLALKRATQWKIFNKLPKHVLDDIMSNSDIKTLILKIWDIAALFLKMHNMPKANFSYQFPLERLGEDPYMARDAIHELGRAIINYRKKYNIDVDGKQLGNVSHWAR